MINYNRMRDGYGGQHYADNNCNCNNSEQLIGQTFSVSLKEQEVDCKSYVDYYATR